MAIDTHWFRSRLADRQLSQRRLAHHIGLDPAAVSLMLRGKRTMRIAEAAEIARLLGVPADEVMEHAGVRLASKGREVSITGIVDGTGEMHISTHEPIGTTLHPGGDLPLEVGCAQCRTAGTDLDYMDGWLLFCTLARDGVTAAAVGRLSFCRLRTGIIMVAKPTRGYVRGRWNIAGPGATASDVDLEWATPVLQIIT